MRPREGVLAKLTSSAAARRAGRGAKAAWKRAFFGPLNLARKARFAALGHGRATTPPTAHLRLAATCSCASKLNFVSRVRNEVTGVAATAACSPLRPTAAVIALDTFDTFEDWRTEVSRRTRGKYHRAANKARRLGYASRMVGKESYARSLYELTGSKLRRSKGLFVWAAVAGAWAGLADTAAPATPPTCPWHWRICWGAFRRTDAGEHLAAFAMLIRAGDTVFIERFIGHGAALADGVTKRLMFDVMAWLLARGEPATSGIRYLLYGHIEEGSIGLFDWKRYLGYQPMLIEVR